MLMVDVATGRTVARTKAVLGISGPGDWRGNTVVAVSSLVRRSALVLLHATANELSVRDTLRLDERAGLTSFYGAHFHLPVLVGKDEVVVGVTSVGRNELDSKVRFLVCELRDRSCRSGRSLEPLTRWATVLTNPSRP
jgi:hypothetical protein